MKFPVKVPTPAHSYSIKFNGTFATFRNHTALTAVEYAAKAVDLPPSQFREHIARLEATGYTAWCYGFSTVYITRNKEL